MFQICYSVQKEVRIGDILTFKKISVEVLKVQGPYILTLNGKEQYKLTVKKYNEKEVI